jgi:hypothetical protein
LNADVVARCNGDLLSYLTHTFVPLMTKHRIKVVSKTIVLIDPTTGRW